MYMFVAGPQDTVQAGLHILREQAWDSYGRAALSQLT